MIIRTFLVAWPEANAELAQLLLGSEDGIMPLIKTQMTPTSETNRQLLMKRQESYAPPSGVGEAAGMPFLPSTPDLSLTDGHWPNGKEKPPTIPSSRWW